MKQCKLGFTRIYREIHSFSNEVKTYIYPLFVSPRYGEVNGGVCDEKGVNGVGKWSRFCPAWGFDETKKKVSIEEWGG